MEQPTRYYRVIGQLDQVTFTKRMLARGTSEQVLKALNDAYPEAHFFQVLEVADLDDGYIIKFVD